MENIISGYSQYMVLCVLMPKLYSPSPFKTKRSSSKNGCPTTYSWWDRGVLFRALSLSHVCKLATKFQTKASFPSLTLRGKEKGSFASCQVPMGGNRL